MTTYKVTLLVTLDSGEEESRRFKVEAWNPDRAVEIAKQEALLDDHVLEAHMEMVE